MKNKTLAVLSLLLVFLTFSGCVSKGDKAEITDVMAKQEMLCMAGYSMCAFPYGDAEPLLTRGEFIEEMNDLYVEYSTQKDTIIDLFEDEWERTLTYSDSDKSGGEYDMHLGVLDAKYDTLKIKDGRAEAEGRMIYWLSAIAVGPAERDEYTLREGEYRVAFKVCYDNFKATLEKADGSWKMVWDNSGGVGDHWLYDDSKAKTFSSYDEALAYAQSAVPDNMFD